jgi:hydrolase, ortholog 1, exosortase system type 1 associated
MHGTETALAFPCGDDTLIGILNQPDNPSTTTGVLIIVGGPQCRTGSHRQFTQLARGLAQRGIPSLRFDTRGMGDSTGAMRNFEDLHDDIHAACQSFVHHSMVPIQRLVLWGLCDAATAAAFYASSHVDICALVLCNPWVRTAQSEALTQVKHYYLKRLLAPALWKKFLTGNFALRQTCHDLITHLRVLTAPASDRPHTPTLPLPERMQRALTQHPRPTLLVLSGCDLTAREFEDAVLGNATWSAWLQDSSIVTRRDLPEADHTFSSRIWTDQVTQFTADWLLEVLELKLS